MLLWRWQQGTHVLGVVEALEQNLEATTGKSWEDFLNGIRGFVGTSAGALLCLLLLLGRRPRR